MKQDFSNYGNEELVLEYQTTQDEAVLQEILIRNKGLLHMWVYLYRNIPYVEEEDLLEEAYIACWRAVKSYDPQRGTSFTTILRAAVTQQLNRLYNEATRKKRCASSPPLSYEKLIEINRDGGSELDNYFTVEAPDLSDIEIREFLTGIGGTTKKVAIRLLRGYSKVEIARELKYTPATISYHVGRLKKAFTAFYAEG